MLISIVGPCYNSEHTIEPLVEACRQEFDHRNDYELEMVLVNDFSKDNTFEVIRKLASKYPFVKGIDLAKNFGQHDALLCGFRYVTGELVVGMDDDLQNHPEQIHSLIAKLNQGYDVVFAKYRKRKYSFTRNITSAVSQFLLHRLIDRPKDVEMSSFWVSRRFVIEEMKKYRGTDAFIQLLFARTTRRITDLEMEHYSRKDGSSNYNFRKRMRLFLSFMSFSTIPLQLATIFGTTFSVIGFIMAIVVFIRKLVHPEVAIGWSSLMCLMLFVAGIIMLMLGIIGSYIGKVVMTMNRTPMFVAREELNVEGGRTHRQGARAWKHSEEREIRKIEKTEEPDDAGENAEELLLK